MLDCGKGKSDLEDLGSLKAKGTYTLVIFIPVELDVMVGGLGMQRFCEGYYTYTGSAFGSGASNLGRRICRHLTKGKRKRWHIDYLLSENNVIVVAVITADTDKRMECDINNHLREKLQAKLPVPRFGASDCKENCGSHLLYLGSDANVVRRIVEIYSRKTKAKMRLLKLH